ncbi:MAG: hypothetical protein V5A62_13465 [Haloarculaceae archaeon]
MREMAATRSDETARTVGSEEVHLRNYDARETYTDALPPGEHDVEVELDGLRLWAGHCRVGRRPEHTVLVEVGNGPVSITEGVPR